MTPDRPSDPQKDKPAETEKAELDVAEAKAAQAAEGPGEQPEPKLKRARAKKAEEPEPGPRDEPESPTPAEVETEVGEEAAKSKPSADDEPTVGRKPSKGKRKQPEAPEAEEKPTRGESARRQPAASSNGDAAVLVRAHAKYVRTSARKARLVCDHIRGKDVEEARAILAFTPRAAAKDWSKLLESAVANAEHNHELVGEELKVVAVFADEGPTLKRFRPRAMGRATRIRKRTSHLTITLTPKGQPGARREGK